MYTYVMSALIAWAQLEDPTCKFRQWVSQKLQFIYRKVNARVFSRETGFSRAAVFLKKPSTRREKTASLREGGLREVVFSGLLKRSRILPSSVSLNKPSSLSKKTASLEKTACEKSSSRVFSGLLKRSQLEEPFYLGEAVFSSRLLG